VIATTVHPICDVRILYREARSLARAGYEVEVIGPPPETGSSLGIAGVTLTVIPRETRRLRRAVLGGWRLLRMLLERRPDVVHLHDPELLWVGLVLRLARRRVVFDLHEDLPLQVLAKPWIPRRLRRAASRAAAVALRVVPRRFDGLVAATDVVARRFPACRRPVVLCNYPVLDLVPRRTRTHGTPTRFIYVGRISRERGALEMLRALAELDRADVELTVVGTVSPGLRGELANAVASRRVRLIPWEPPLRIYEHLAQADVGVMCLDPLQRFVDALPVKLFEYMAAELPVIVSDLPRLREIVQGADCGLLVDPLDSSSLADAMRRLADSPEERRRLGENGRNAVRERYNWGSEEAKLLELYARLTRKHAGRPSR
jgi:glycosyltransferase involved in cell wall biosynthesis